jgi:hypothetical protein
MKPASEFVANNQSTAEALGSQILELAQKLQTCQQEGRLTVADATVKAALSQLRGLIAHTTDERAEEILERPDIHSLIPWLQAISSLTEAETEKQYSAQLCERISAFPWPTDRRAATREFCRLLEKHYILEEYPRVITAELALAQDLCWNSRSKLVFAGCGALPLTAILLALHTDASVVGLDCDIEAVMTALDLVRALEHRGVLPAGKVLIEHERAEEFNYRGYDAVIVANLIPNEVKRMILQKTAALQKAGLGLLLRTGRGLGELLYSHYEPDEIASRQGSRMKLAGETRPRRYHRKGQAKNAPKIVEKEGLLLIATVLYIIDAAVRQRGKLDLGGGNGAENDAWQTGNKTSMNAKIIVKHGQRAGGFASSKLMDYL